MVKLTVQPMIGQVEHDRLHSLRNCHALFERSVIVNCSQEDFQRKLADAVKELMLVDRARALTGVMQFILTVEVK